MPSFGVEEAGDFAETDGGVGADPALIVARLKPGEMLHQFLVQIVVVQLLGHEHHRLE